MRLWLNTTLSALALALLGTSAACELARKDGPDTGSFVGGGGGTTTGNAAAKAPLYYTKLKGLGGMGSLGIPFITEAHASNQIGLCVDRILLMDEQGNELGQTMVEKWITVAEMTETLVTAFNYAGSTPFEKIYVILQASAPTCGGLSFSVDVGNGAITGVSQATLKFHNVGALSTLVAQDVRMSWSDLGSGLQQAQTLFEVLNAFRTLEGTFTLEPVATEPITVTSGVYMNAAVSDVSLCPATLEMDLFNLPGKISVPFPASSSTVLLASGNTLATLDIPHGTYEEMRIILDRETSAACANSQTATSMGFRLSGMSYSSNEVIGMRFQPDNVSSVTVDNALNGLVLVTQVVADLIAGYYPGETLPAIFAAHRSLYDPVP